MKNGSLKLIIKILLSWFAYFPFLLQAYEMKPIKYYTSSRKFFGGFDLVSNGASSGLVGRSQIRFFQKSTALSLNRFLFDPLEVDAVNEKEGKDGSVPRNQAKKETVPLVVTLPKSDYRTVHAAKVLGLMNGDTIRAGIVKDRDYDSNEKRNIPEIVRNYCGCITDDAQIEWIPEGKIKKAQPTKNGDPPGSLRIHLTSLKDVMSFPNSNPRGNSTIPVSLILALPRPLQLQRMLPMIAQMGVDHIVLSTAQKVPKDYFGSHLFRQPDVLRNLLIEGLCQAGDVVLPKVTVVRRLKPFIEDDLDSLFPSHEYAKAIAHPQRLEDDSKPLRMKNISFENVDLPRIVVAVGPEGGWAEPHELQLFKEHNFEQITLGTRVLRSDVAVVNLLGLAHDTISEQNEKQTTH